MKVLEVKTMKMLDHSTGVEREIKQHDIIQANPKVKNWARCLLIVDEVKSWGVQAYTVIPAARDAPSGDAPMRLSWDEFDLVGGRSLWQVAHDDEKG
jgi:hypothetical protein